MLVWINGPFGVGKTATASELHRRLPGSVVCDPEHLGFGLHRMLPPALRTNFQDLPAWRSGVREVLACISAPVRDKLPAHPLGLSRLLSLPGPELVRGRTCKRVIEPPAPDSRPLILTFDGKVIVMLPDALRPAAAKAAAARAAGAGQVADRLGHR